MGCLRVPEETGKLLWETKVRMSLTKQVRVTALCYEESLLGLEPLSADGIKRFPGGATPGLCAHYHDDLVVFPVLGAAALDAQGLLP